MRHHEDGMSTCPGWDYPQTSQTSLKVSKQAQMSKQVPLAGASQQEVLVSGAVPVIVSVLQNSEIWQYKVEMLNDTGLM